MTLLLKISFVMFHVYNSVGLIESFHWFYLQTL